MSATRWRACATSCPTPSTSRSSPRSRPTPSRSSTSAVRGRHAAADRGLRLRQPLRKPRLSVLPGAADVRIFGERQVVDAHRHRPHAAGRLQAHRAGRRGRASAGRTRRSRPVASSRRRASSRSSPRPTCRRPSSSTASSSPTSAAIRCASATSALAEIGAIDERTISRYNGKPSLNIGVIKQAVAIRSTCRTRYAPKWTAINEDLPPGMKVIVAYDTSVFIDRSIKSVFETIGEAILLVVLVIFFFLRSFRATLIPLVTIPVSLIGAFGADVRVRLHDQHADAARDGARDRPRRRRRHRGAGEHLPARRVRDADPAGGDHGSRARSVSRSWQ